MGNYKIGSHRGLRGNVFITVAAVVLAAAVLAAAAMLYRRGAGARGAASPPVSSSSQAPSSSSAPSAVQSSSSAASSSSQESSSSAPSSSSSSAPVSAASFKGAVFVGDSLTDGLALYNVMDDATVYGETGMSAYTAVAHKFKLDGAQQYVADAAAAKKPKSVYFLLGSNDIAEGYSAAKFTGYYGGLLDAVHAKCPDAKLFVQSVFPVTAAYEHKKFSSGVYMTNSRIDQFNVAVKAMAAQHGAVYLDVESVLKGPDGKLPASASDDGMHLRKAYYDKWFSYLAAHL